MRSPAGFAVAARSRRRASGLRPGLEEDSLRSSPQAGASPSAGQAGIRCHGGPGGSGGSRQLSAVAVTASRTGRIKPPGQVLADRFDGCLHFINLLGHAVPQVLRGTGDLGPESS